MEWLSMKKEATVRDIDFIEKKYGIRLPQDYQDVICQANGAALKNAYIEVEDMGKVSYSRNISINQDAKISIYDLIECVNDKAVRYFPFASVGDGDYFCFDLCKRRVVLYLHEIQSYKDICGTFTELLSRIKFD